MALIRRAAVLFMLAATPAAAAPTLRTPTFTSLIQVGGGHTIEDEGTPLTQRQTLNFVGANISCADSGGKTVCTITGGSNPFADDTAILMDNADNTKLLRFELGGFTTGVTRVITPPNVNTSLPWIQHTLTFSGFTAARTLTFSDSNHTVAGINVAQTWTALQKFQGSGANSTQINSSSSTFTGTTVVGESITPGANDQTILGYLADCNASASGCVAIARQASARGSESIAIGYQAFTSSGHTNSVVLGALASSSAANQLAVGANGRAVKDWFAPNSVTAASPETLTINGTGGSGTNIGGSRLVLAGGRSTGNAVPALVALQTGALGGSSGTTAQTLVDRVFVGASKVLTNNTTTTVANVTDANNTVAAVKLHYAVEVFDGTDVQVEEGDISCHVTNKGGTIANNTCIKYGNQQAVTASTLTVTWTITAANPALLQVNANSGLTPSAGYPRVTYDLFNLTQQAVAIQ